MRILFIGGTGTISAACSALAVARGMDVTLLNRGTTDRPIPSGARVLHADIRDTAAVALLLRDDTYEAVVNWIAYTPEQVAADAVLFRGRTRQYVFISSASVYRKPAALPVVESAPVGNPAWPYAEQKLACERLLQAAHAAGDLPATIVRPSHTYDERMIPHRSRYGLLRRLREGRPVVVHGDGTSLWTLTHARDFARGFVPLLGDGRALGEAFHITSDEWLTWDGIVGAFAAELGVEPHLVHVPSDTIAAFDPGWGASLLGDKAHSMVFNNSKIRALAPDFRPVVLFAEGVAEIIAWYKAHPESQRLDPAHEALVDRLAAGQAAVRRLGA